MIEVMNQVAQGDQMVYQSGGPVGAQLLANNMDINCMRPWVGKDRRHYIKKTIWNHKTQKFEEKAVPTNNVVATLRRDEWMQIDDVVSRAVRNRLRLVSDIRGAGLEFRVNGMSKTVLESSTMTRAGRATLSMDPARISEGDRPEFDQAYLPLPICHYDVYFNLREIAVSRNGGQPLDTVMVEEAGISVAEEIEQLTLGTLDTYTYGGGTIYGMLNFPSRATVDLTAPTDSSWTGALLIDEVLSMRGEASDRHRYGPYILYVSPDWAQYLDADYSASKGDNTVRDRILKIEGITEIRQLDYLTGFQFILIEMTARNIRMVIGLEVTTIQWDTIGGMRQNFKVMALQVPQLRTDGDGNSGVVHGSTEESDLD